MSFTDIAAQYAALQKAHLRVENDQIPHDVPLPAGTAAMAARLTGPEERNRDVAAKLKLVDDMVAKGNQGYDVDPACRAKIGDVLRSYPLEMLKVVSLSGNTIQVLKAGQTSEDRGIYEHVDRTALRSQWQGMAPDITSARGQADEVLGDLAHQASAHAVQGLEMWHDGARAAGTDCHGFNVAGETGAPEAPDEVRLAVNQVYVTQMQQQKITVTALGAKGVNAHLTPWSPFTGVWLPDQDDGPLEMTTLLPSRPDGCNYLTVTPEVVAERHGARTPDEMRAYLDDLKAVNGEGAIRKAQAEYSELHQAAHPEEHLSDTLPWEKSPMGASANLLMPDYFFIHDGDRPAILLSGMDARDYSEWKKGNLLGQSLDRGDTHSLILREDHITEPEGEGTILHEFEHRHRKALLWFDDSYGVKMEQAMAHEHGRKTIEGEEFPSLYAQISGSPEERAEAMASMVGHGTGDRLPPSERMATLLAATGARSAELAHEFDSGARTPQPLPYQSWTVPEDPAENTPYHS